MLLVHALIITFYLFIHIPFSKILHFPVGKNAAENTDVPFLDFAKIFNISLFTFSIVSSLLSPCLSVFAMVSYCSQKSDKKCAPETGEKC